MSDKTRDETRASRLQALGQGRSHVQQARRLLLQALAEVEAFMRREAYDDPKAPEPEVLATAGAATLYAFEHLIESRALLALVRALDDAEIRRYLGREES